MRFISLAITMLSVLISLFLGFKIMSDNNQIEKIEERITDIETINSNYIRDTEKLLVEISTLTADRDALIPQVEDARLIHTYKTQKTAFLTFDDGPTSSNTTKILDILKENHVKATFFVVGSMIEQGGKSNLIRMAQEGHSIGIHAYNHSYSEVYASKEAYLADLKKASDLVESLTGIKPTVIRMPGGTAKARSDLGEAVYKELVAELLNMGYYIDDWTVDTSDWSGISASEILNNAVTGAKKRLNYTYKTAIILMHDTKQNTAIALQDMIETLKKEGFVFDVLSNRGYSYRQY